MEKKIITQAERTTLFNEWLRTQKMPKFEETIDRQRWWVNKAIEFDKMTAQDYDVCGEFWTDGKIHNPNKSGEE